LQIAHTMLQVFEQSTLRCRLAALWGQTPWQLFGSLKNLARRLLESFRHGVRSPDAFDPSRAWRLRIGFNTS
jgi:hypothetical protein